MFRRILLLTVLSLTLSGLALARTERIRISSAGRPWRVELAGTNTFFLAKDRPVVRGSMLIFHGYPDGRLIAIPEEQVASIRHGGSRAPSDDLTEVAAVRIASELQPGEVRMLGETGGGSSATVRQAGGGYYSPSSLGSGGTTAEDPGRLAIDSLVFRGDTTAAPGVPMYGYGGYAAGGMVRNPTLVNPLPATATGTTLIAPNGFPISTIEAGSQPISPNGFPTTTMTGAESGTQPINPNGFPSTTTTGAETGTQPIDSNGFPTLTAPPNAGTGRSSTQPRGPSPR